MAEPQTDLTLEQEDAAGRFERTLAPMQPRERFTVGDQPCQDFLRGDADIAALGEGNGRNLHQCPKCSGNRAWCDNCLRDHHDGGWETCKPGAYSDLED